MSEKNGVTVEQRLKSLENEVVALRHALEAMREGKKPGWRAIVGRHKGSQAFAEMVKLGQQIRRGELVVTYKTKKKKKPAGGSRKVAGKE